MPCIYFTLIPQVIKPYFTRVYQSFAQIQRRYRLTYAFQKSIIKQVGQKRGSSSSTECHCQNNIACGKWTIRRSEKELSRLNELERADAHSFNQKDGPKRLWISERQVRRLPRQYRCAGVSGLVYKKRGKPSNRGTEPPWKEKVITFIIDVLLQGFSPSFTAEKLEVFRASNYPKNRFGNIWWRQASGKQ